MKAKMMVISLLLVALGLPLAACQGIQIQQVTPALTASGTISADSTRVGSEMGGKILDIKVNQGDTVKAGDVLFTLDSQLLQAQHDEAAAAVQVAQAGVDEAQKKLANAQAQYALTLQSAQMQNSQSQTTAWQATQPAQFSEPDWYFQKSEQITALQSEIGNAQTALTSEQANLQNELKNSSNEDFVAGRNAPGSCRSGLPGRQRDLRPGQSRQGHHQPERCRPKGDGCCPIRAECGPGRL